MNFLTKLSQSSADPSSSSCDQQRAWGFNSISHANHTENWPNALPHATQLHTKFFWQHNIHCGSSSALEQFAIWNKTTWLVLWSV